MGILTLTHGPDAMKHVTCAYTRHRAGVAFRWLDNYGRSWNTNSFYKLSPTVRPCEYSSM